MTTTSGKRTDARTSAAKQSSRVGMSGQSSPPSRHDGEAGEDRLSRFFAVKRGGTGVAERSRLLKKFLPWVTGVVLIGLLAWPFINKNSDSVTLSYKDLVGKSEQVRIVGAHYIGTDNRNRPFKVTAEEGFQERSDSDYATLTKVAATLELAPEDQVTVTSGSGHYDRAKDLLNLENGITLQSSSGYALKTERASLNLATNVASGSENVTGAAPFGDFAADGFTLNVDNRHLVLEGGVRVKLDPGKRTTDPGKAAEPAQ